MKERDNIKKEAFRYTQNRELSWLRFDQRVLEEAQDQSVPLLERMKFVSIFTSNLDEFFMIRVGSLYDMAAVDNKQTDSRSGMTPREQLDAIYIKNGIRLMRRSRSIWHSTESAERVLKNWRRRRKNM